MSQPPEWPQSLNRTLIIITVWIAAAIATFGLAIYGAEAQINAASAWVLSIPMGVALLASMIFWILPDLRPKGIF